MEKQEKKVIDLLQENEDRADDMSIGVAMKLTKEVKKLIKLAKKNSN